MTTKKKRTCHSPEFKAEALKLAEKTSVPFAAKELGLKESQLYTWQPAGKNPSVNGNPHWLPKIQSSNENWPNRLRSLKS